MVMIWQWSGTWNLEQIVNLFSSPGTPVSDVRPWIRVFTPGNKQLKKHRSLSSLLVHSVNILPKYEGWKDEWLIQNKNIDSSTSLISSSPAGRDFMVIFKLIVLPKLGIDRLWLMVIMCPWSWHVTSVSISADISDPHMVDISVIRSVQPGCVSSTFTLSPVK